MSDKFTPDEAKFINDLSQLNVTMPIAQAAMVAQIWASILAKVEANTETVATYSTTQ